MLISIEVIIRSVPIHLTAGQAVQIFPATTWNFMKETALLENCRGMARYVYAVHAEIIVAT
jgi:hypothetical protein